MPSLRVEGLSKTYIAPGRSRIQAVHGLTFSVPAGQCLCLAGPSGSGKSTTLRLIAGLESPDAGRVWIDDREITSHEPSDRGIAFLFQNAALYPHLGVRENIGFPLRVRGHKATELTPRVTEAIQRFGLTHLADRLPESLSGGERQRVALARAWIQQPKVLLLDEPFNGLDAPTRLELRRLLRRLHSDSFTAVVHVTHDPGEALSTGDSLAILRSGTIEQWDKPRTVYHRPANAFVAGFLGSPGMNLIEGSLLHDGGRTRFRAKVSGELLPIEVAQGIAPREDCHAFLGFRPEAVQREEVFDVPTGFSPEWVECRGPDWVVGGDWHGVPVQLIERGPEPSRQGKWRLTFHPNSLHWFRASTGERM